MLQAIRKPSTPRRRLAGCLVGLLTLALLVGSYIGWGLWSSRWPAAINMGSDSHGMAMPGMDPLPAGGAVRSVTDFQAPLTAAHIRRFTLTAQAAHLDLGGGVAVDAWTFNGTAPGPLLRVNQGDLVIVTLTNTLPVGVTLHWHGVAVPNAADGTAGVTQAAVGRGQAYTYRFIAKDAGTYWYHSHQQSDLALARGLFGMLIVDPPQPDVPTDVDAAVILHDWRSLNAGRTLNDTQSLYRITAKPGDWVRLRLLNTTNNPLGATLLGAPFRVIALDGHNLNGPQPLTATLLPLGSGQRFDMSFQMPPTGAVRVVITGEKGEVLEAPTALIGPPTATLNDAPAAVGLAIHWFDFAGYGVPRDDAINPRSHFDQSVAMVLGKRLDFLNGGFTMNYSINGQAFPHIAPIVVQEGQLVKIRISDESGDPHPIHIHGHTFAVLSRNGQPLTGSPVYLDTILVQPHESYEIAFRADNPGLWMDHCHNLNHAARGMDMMIVYPNIATPFTIGTQTGDIPE